MSGGGGGGGRGGNEKEVTVALLEGEEEEEMTGAVLGGEEEWMELGRTQKEVEEVAVLEGRWRRIAKTVCFQHFSS